MKRIVRKKAMDTRCLNKRTASQHELILHEKIQLINGLQAKLTDRDIN